MRSQTITGKTKKGGTAGEALRFFRGFLRHPNMVGWLVPSSRFVVSEVLKEVDWAQARVILEYGPGLGNFTTRILENMRQDARLIVFEINPEFIKSLRASFSDPRLLVMERSAADADKVLAELGYEHADVVISGIPFSPIPHELRKDIVTRTHSILRPGGKFLVYQFSGAVLPYLRETFGPVACDRELLNLLPTRLFFCQRAGAEKRRG